MIGELSIAHRMARSQGCSVGAPINRGPHEHWRPRRLVQHDVDADRAFLCDRLGTTTVDAGGGWLILALPPAEIAVHPTGGPIHHKLYLMCDDIDATVGELGARGVVVEGGISDQGWGRSATIRLPGGAALGVYEPRHPVAAGT